MGSEMCIRDSNLTMYSIEKFMEGDIDEMVNALTAEDQAQKMAEFGE